MLDVRTDIVTSEVKPDLIVSVTIQYISDDGEAHPLELETLQIDYLNMYRENHNMDLTNEDAVRTLGFVSICLVEVNSVLLKLDFAYFDFLVGAAMLGKSMRLQRQSDMEAHHAAMEAEDFEEIEPLTEYDFDADLNPKNKIIH